MDDAAAARHSERSIFIPAEDFQDRHELEKERLWPRIWQMACRESDLPSRGSFVRYDILDDSILVVRTGEAPDALAAFYNVCQHRGRRLVDEPHGVLEAGATCRFHGWRYDLSGGLLGVYVEDDWAGCPSFDRSKLNIPQVKLARWGGWIWINQDPDAEPFESWLGALADKLAPFDLATMRPLWWKTILADVNWKIVVEAFVEGYHSGATHVSGINYGPLRSPTEVCGPHGMFYSDAVSFTNYRDRDRDTWIKPRSFQENLWANHRHLFHTLHALTLAPGMAAYDRVRDLPPELSPEQVLAQAFRCHREELERSGAPWPKDMTFETWLASPTDVHIFPNSVVLPTLDGALWYRLRPHRTDREKCIFDIWSFGRFAPGAEPDVKQEVFEGFDAFKGQCEFLEEDFSNMQAVNEGVKCRGFRGAVVNPVQESTITNFRRTLKGFVEPGPAKTAVKKDDGERVDRKAEE